MEMQNSQTILTNGKFTKLIIAHIQLLTYLPLAEDVNVFVIVGCHTKVWLNFVLMQFMFYLKIGDSEFV